MLIFTNFEQPLQVDGNILFICCSTKKQFSDLTISGKAIILEPYLRCDSKFQKYKGLHRFASRSYLALAKSPFALLSFCLSIFKC